MLIVAQLTYGTRNLLLKVVQIGFLFPHTSIYI